MSLWLSDLSLSRFLGCVDLIGTMYEDEVIATSFGNYVCLPLLRKAGTDLSKEDAKKVLEDCLRVLFYRNTKSSTRVRLLDSHCRLATDISLAEAREARLSYDL